MINPDELGLETFGGTGDEVLVRCPYHDDSHPSARFNVQTGLFYCFSCGVGKSAKQVADDLGGVVSDAPMKVKRHFEEPDIDWRTRFLRLRLATDNLYLKSRQVPNVAVEKLQIRAFEDGIVFPLFCTTQGEICGVQIRQYTKTPKYLFYGDIPAIYPMTGLPATEYAILVEGVFSVIRGRSAGFETFAVMGATKLGGGLKYFFDRTKVRGVFDPDGAGYTASAKLSAIGIPCLRYEFEADERSIDDWRTVIGTKSNFSMDTTYFMRKAIAAGVRPSTLASQVLKFEKENNYA